MPSIFIATPTTGGVVKARYARCIAALTGRLDAKGIEHAYFLLDLSGLVYQRDLMASMFLEEERWTHLLFIDSDMTFQPTLAEELLSLGKDCVGAIYPSRQQGDGRYIVRFESEPPTIEGGLYRCLYIGFGFMLLSRACVQRVAESNQVARYPSRAPTPKMLWSMFRQIESPEGGLWGEDASFLLRWRNLGGEVWGYPKSNIGHVGEIELNLQFADAMKAHASPSG
jgi:hypothetical protein